MCAYILRTHSVSCLSELIHYSFGAELVNVNVLTYCNVHITELVVTVFVCNDLLEKFSGKPNVTQNVFVCILN